MNGDKALVLKNYREPKRSTERGWGEAQPQH